MSCGFETLDDEKEFQANLLEPLEDWGMPHVEGDDIAASEVSSTIRLVLPIYRMQPMSFDSLGLKHILDQVSEVAEEAEEGEKQPTQEATEKLIDVLPAAWAQLCEEQIASGKQARFPRGSVTTDGEGGLRVEWRTDDAAVHFVIGLDGRNGTYIYHSQGASYAADKRVTPYSLARWLRTVEPA